MTFSSSPTYFHEQAARLRPGAVAPSIPLPEGEPETVEIRLFAQVVETRRLTNLDAALALEPLHVSQPQVVEERFQWGDAPGLSLALLRVFRLERPGTGATRVLRRLPFLARSARQRGAPRRLARNDGPGPQRGSYR